MLALTVVQPFASALVLGLKPAELRPWPIPPRFVGERVLIHAGAGDHRRVKLPGTMAADAAAELAPQLPDPPRRAFVGWCVFDTAEAHPSLAGIMLWPVRQAHAFLRPLPADGRVGLWSAVVDDDEINALG